MKQKSYWTKSEFPVSITYRASGKTVLESRDGKLFDVYRKDGSKLTLEEVEKIAENDWGFWKIVKEFRLVVEPLEEGK